MKKILLFGFVFCTINAIAQYSIEGIVGKYSFSGNANDESHNAYRGIITEATLATNRFGCPNSAFTFNGYSSYIQIPDTFLQNNEYSISLWALLKSIPPDGEREIILSIGSTGGDQFINYNKNYAGFNGWSCGGYNIGAKQFAFSQGETPNTNEWYHLVVTRDTSRMLFYVNNSFVAADSFATKIFPNYGTGEVKGNIGQRFNNTLPFNGDIDDIVIYNRFIDSSEIALLYLEGFCNQYVYDTTYIEVTDTNYIVVSDTLIININVNSINTAEEINVIKIYPNPATDYLYIDNGNYFLMQEYFIVIQNLLGQTVFQSPINQQRFEINLSTFGAKGTYLVKFTNSQNIVIETKKLVIR